MPRRSPLVHALSLAALALLLAPAAAGAQGWKDRIKSRVKDRVGQQVDQTTDSATDAAIAGSKKAIRCAVSDRKCVKKAEAAGQTPVFVDATGNALPDQAAAARQAGAAAPAAATPAASSGGAPAGDATAAPAQADPPGKGAWLNYDFVPGDTPLFVEDFQGNDVGDFPRRLHLQEGNMEVVMVQGQPMLRSVEGGSFFVVLPRKLPERFTVEIRWHGGVLTNPIFVNTSAGTYERGATLACVENEAYVSANGSGGPERSGSAAYADAPPGFTDCRFTVDNGRGIKGYVDEHRTANAPQVHVVLGDTLFFQVPGGSEEDPILVASIRVAAGGKKLYDALLANGRVATQGILFATGSDQIRGESTPTLKEIATMLAEHPALRLRIEGHTDDVGAGAANQSLSERRAAAVKGWLVANGADAGRLETAGFGSTKPVAPNGTAEGRQQNRRVELVKLGGAQ